MLIQDNTVLEGKLPHFGGQTTHSPSANMPPAGEEVITIVTKHADSLSLAPIDRFEFYTQAHRCFAVVQTLERRPCVEYNY